LGGCLGTVCLADALSSWSCAGPVVGRQGSSRQSDLASVVECIVVGCIEV
jgi:hypothetical protein